MPARVFAERKLSVMASLKDVIGHAMALHQKGDEDAAAAVFEKVLKAKPDDPMALEYLGLRALKKKDFTQSIALLRQAVAQPKCRPGTRLQLGHALRDSGQLSDAADAYRRYTTDSSDPTGATTLADLLFDLDRIQEAENVLRQAVEWKPDHVKALCLLAIACDKLQKPTEAQDFRRRAVESPDDSASSRLMKGAAHLDLGEIEEAFEVLGDAANSLQGQALADAVSNLDLDSLPDLQGQMPSSMGVPLIVASGDPKYVQRFAPDLIRSVGENSQGTDIHVHVIVPSTGEAPPPLPADLPTHSLSWENEPSAKRTTFATRRFVRAATFMRALDRQLIIIDLDSVVKKDVASAVTGLPEFDVALRNRPEEVLLSQRLAAGFVALSPTKAAQKFIDVVAAYILHFERAGSAVWFLDQMALLTARCHLTPEAFKVTHEVAGDDTETVEPTTPTLQIIDVPERFLDWRRHSADSVIWTAKGAGKTLPK